MYEIAKNQQSFNKLQTGAWKRIRSFYTRSGEINHHVT